MARYVGGRIVPTHGGVWDGSKSYEELTIVLRDDTGDSYISKRPVLAGTAITEEHYWVLYSKYSAQVKLAVDNANTMAALIRGEMNTQTQQVAECLKQTEEACDERVEAAETLTNQNKATLEKRMSQIEVRQEANVRASTDADADYATEVVDARIGVEGRVYSNVGMAIRNQVVELAKGAELTRSRNLYDPSLNTIGKYLNRYGTLLDDERYAVSGKILVPPGKTIFTTAKVNGKYYRQIANSVRSFTVFNRSGDVINYDDTQVAGTYTNDTEEDAFIAYNTWYAHNTVAEELMAEIVDSLDDVAIHDYFPYGYENALRIDLNAMDTRLKKAEESIAVGVDEHHIAQDIRDKLQTITPVIYRKQSYWYVQSSVTPRNMRYAGNENTSIVSFSLEDVELGVFVCLGAEPFSQPLMVAKGAEIGDEAITYNTITELQRGRSYAELFLRNGLYYLRIRKEELLATYPEAGGIFITMEMVTEDYHKITAFGGDRVLEWLKVTDENLASDKVSSAYEQGKKAADMLRIVQPTGNLLDWDKCTMGYANNARYVLVEDERYAATEKIPVPDGKTIYSSARLYQNSFRQLANSARSIYIYNEDGTGYTYTDKMSELYWTNDTGETKYAVFNVFIHHDVVANDVYIGLVDSLDDMDASVYEPFGYKPTDLFIGVLSDVALDPIRTDVAEVQDHLAQIDESMKSVQDYFLEELEVTSDSIRQVTTGPCLTYSIVTDSHIRPSIADSVRRTYETVANVKKLNEMCHADAVVHLGDLVDQQMYITDQATDDEIWKTMQEYIIRFSQANRHAYIVNGNHDGHVANVFYEKEWYSICGRLNEDDVNRYLATGYFFVDYPKLRTRCVFMSTPDNIDDGNTIFGWTQRQLRWLAEEALDTPNDYGVLLFMHIAPDYKMYLESNGGTVNRDDFYGICNAYHSHTAYDGRLQSCDYTGKTGTKIVACIAGHSHADNVVDVGAVRNGEDKNGNMVELKNELPCKIIVITCAMMSGTGTNAKDDYTAFRPARKSKTVTQDAWDTMVYRPDLNKIYMIRFGAGEDREIDVN